MQEIMDNITNWWTDANDTNGNVILAAVITAMVIGFLGFLGGGRREKLKQNNSEANTESQKISEVFSFNAESVKLSGSSRKIYLRMHNSSDQNRKFELKSALKDAGDPNDSLKGTLVGTFTGVIEISARNNEDVEVGGIISAMGSPGRVICQFTISPLDWGEPFEGEKEVRHI